MAAALGGVPRVDLVSNPTPLEPADRLASSLGLRSGTLWIKRDDLAGLAGGGNKARKLEFHCAAAIEAGCDWLVTGGGLQSNHARLTAAAAAHFGLGSSIVLTGDRPERVSGNLLLDHLLGANIVFAGAISDDDAELAIHAEADRLNASGRRAHAIPIGGSDPLGCQGYVRAAVEILAQLPDLELVVCASASAGTHAGLVAGLGDHRKVLGVRVGTRRDLRDRITRLAADAASLAGLPAPNGSCQLDENQLGAGYASPTKECGEAILLAARTEGLILDPVYTGKAMAGFVDAARRGEIASGSKVVFLHSGGLPGLLADERADWASHL